MAEMLHFPEGALVAVLTTEPLDRMLDYRAPQGGVGVGDFVVVPLGPRQVLGLVWSGGKGNFDPAKIRAVSRVLDLPPMQAPMRQFLARAGEYTLTPMDVMLRLATRVPGLGEPAGMRKVLRRGTEMPERQSAARKRVIEVLEDHGGLGFAPGELARIAGVSASVVKGLVASGAVIEESLAREMPYTPMQTGPGQRQLSDEQARLAGVLRQGVGQGYSTTLLQGVTGSGKTEVYLEAVAACIAGGKQALVMLPEIALTAEFLDRVEQRFGARPAEWHSGVTEAERRRAWRAVAAGEVQLVVGARSALFLPFADLGLIVVDEEHDQSYKQEDGALYHARDMAVLRASLCGAVVILASATPSLESWANAQAGKYLRLVLPERFGQARLPQMAAIDLRQGGLENNSWISEQLVAALNDRLAAGEQSLLFLNRRGYAPVTLCRACGQQIGCDQCDARMVEHRFQKKLVCHQCGATRPLPETCPSCGVAGRMAAIGPGVERLAEEAAMRFPQARIALLSSDLAQSARERKRLIAEIAGGAADIVIGTQMVAKGHNFPLLTLVGVIDADLGLQGGDLRAAEKTFQLIRQVAGRAGRADRPGTALIQTHQPDHPVIRAIIAGEEEAFWRAEAAMREAAGVPPYGRMAGVVVSGPVERVVLDTALFLARNAAMLEAIGCQVFGPAPAPVARIRGRHRVRLLVKAPKGLAFQNALAAWRAQVKPVGNLRIAIDIDPQSFY